MHTLGDNDSQPTPNLHADDDTGKKRNPSKISILPAIGVSKRYLDTRPSLSKLCTGVFGIRGGEIMIRLCLFFLDFESALTKPYHEF